MENYIENTEKKVHELLKDMKAKGDCLAIYIFGNQVNALAARRGLPYERPVPVLPQHFDKRLVKEERDEM